MKNLTDYSLAQLIRMRQRTDENTYPQRYDALCRAISRHQQAQSCLQARVFSNAQRSDIVPINLWFVRFIAIVSIGGCFIGLTTIINHLMQPQDIFSYLIFAIFFVVFIVGIAVAVRLIESRSVAALTDNRNFWAIQIVFFSSPIMAYQLTNGLLINFWITHTDGLQHGLMIGSAFSLNFLNTNQPWALGINLVALAITGYLQVSLSRFTRHQRNIPQHAE
ncbi:hypothetical protein [Alteromonas halophila]|uniref:Uncharacterized protein n=1 Tax=Alteromonas halophila TaxID=516698 RepID=A0A918JG00_9ALTE|nr:hypothetical protein [Alteromonas halophila]GGW76788.1 hypothetical protein GCM10007391_06990 [Alteromonas halophila]